MFRRHQNCHCQVTYKTIKYKQDVWSKEKTALDKTVKNSKMELNIVNNAIKNGQVSKTINKEKQNRHIKGSKGYIEGRSYIFGTIEDAQRLVDELSGTGKPIIDGNGNWTNKERVEKPDVIGVYKNLDGSIEYETNKATIIYSKTGSHIVPRERVNNNEVK